MSIDLTYSKLFCALIIPILFSPLYTSCLCFTHWPACGPFPGSTHPILGWPYPLSESHLCPRSVSFTPLPSTRGPLRSRSIDRQKNAPSSTSASSESISNVAQVSWFKISFFTSRVLYILALLSYMLIYIYLGTCMERLKYVLKTKWSKRLPRMSNKDNIMKR